VERSAGFGELKTFLPYWEFYYLLGQIFEECTTGRLYKNEAKQPFCPVDFGQLF
jgi:hypothetical protein